MNSQERVRSIIDGLPADRMPIHGWVKLNLEEKISERFGSVENFEDHYEFDLAHLFGGPACFFEDDEYWARKKAGETVEPDECVDLPFNDPGDDEAYEGLRRSIRHHKEERGRFVYVQTPGILEKVNQYFGIENHLAYLIEFPDELKVIYQKQADWNCRFADKCLDYGVDMIHVSDDWGSQRSLLINPDTWWEMIYPYHKQLADCVKKRGGYLSLHSDGNINDVVDGIKRIGYDVVHPWQESAGMSYEDFKRNHLDAFVIMSGYDVQTTLGFGNLDAVKAAGERAGRLFKNGGMIFNTTHFVQAHCSIDELTYAYDLIHKLIRQ